MIYVMLCVNEDHGTLSGKCSALDLTDGPEIAIDLKAGNLDGYAFKVVDEQNEELHTDLRIRLHGQWFYCHRGGEWVGNIYWNSYGFPESELLRLFKTIKKSGLWSADGGLETWWDWWELLTNETTEMPKLEKP